MSLEAVSALCFVIAVLSLIAAVVGMFKDTDHDWPMWMIGSFIICSIVSIICLIPVWARQDANLMAECLKDHKEYECVSMLRRHTDSTSVVIIPTR